MDTRPKIKDYRGSIVASILVIVATINLVFGILGLAIAIPSSSGAGASEARAFAIYGGLIALLSSIPLYGFASIIESTHHNDYLTYYYGEEEYNYHTQELQKLQSIEAMLQQQAASHREYRPESAHRDVQHDTFVEL